MAHNRIHFPIVQYATDGAPTATCIISTREQLILQTILISLVCKYLAGLVAHSTPFVVCVVLKVITVRVQFIVENAADGIAVIVLLHEEVTPLTE